MSLACSRGLFQQERFSLLLQPTPLGRSWGVPKPVERCIQGHSGHFPKPPHLFSTLRSSSSSLTPSCMSEILTLSLRLTKRWKVTMGDHAMPMWASEWCDSKPVSSHSQQKPGVKKWQHQSHIKFYFWSHCCPHFDHNLKRKNPICIWFSRSYNLL